MASRPAPAAFLLLAGLALLTVGAAAARPCKTLFVSYTFSSDASAGAALEVSQISDPGDQPQHRFFAIYRLIPFRNYRYWSYSSPVAATEPLAATLRLPAGIERPALPRPLVRAEPSFGVSSFRERARDILVVVAGLLFGVGCAAVISATVYLAWYLVSNRYEVCGSDGYDYIDEDDTVEIPKKMGYSDLPAMPASPVTPLKEGSGGN